MVGATLRGMERNQQKLLERRNALHMESHVKPAVDFIITKVHVVLKPAGPVQLASSPPPCLTLSLPAWVQGPSAS